VPDEEESYSTKPKGGFAGFAAIADTNDIGDLSEDEEGAGGLMSLLKTTQNKAKDKKNKKKAKSNLPAVDLPEEADGEVSSKQPVEVTAEDLADEEWGPVKEKKKKDKKGKKKGEGCSGR